LKRWIQLSTSPLNATAATQAASGESANSHDAQRPPDGPALRPAADVTRTA
jgi:hypothetical protein